MLSEQEKREIEEELAHYEQKRGACIEALKIVQRHRGWVSDEALLEIAPLLDMTPDELDSVATFYNLIFRKPVGKHVILLCNSISCWIMGYEALRQRLHDRLGVRFGETTADGQFTVLPIVCLGTCDHAPALMIDNDLYRDVSPEKIDEVLARYADGQVPAAPMGREVNGKAADGEPAGGRATAESTGIRETGGLSGPS